MQRSIAGTLALLFLVLAAANFVCALPCESAAVPAKPDRTAVTTHCQTAEADRDTMTISPADPCAGDHGRLAPAEVTSRRAMSPSAVLVSVPRLLRALQQGDSSAVAPFRSPGAGAAPVAPPLRI
jgi:hypothetical protein